VTSSFQLVSVSSLGFGARAYQPEGGSGKRQRLCRLALREGAGGLGVYQKPTRKVTRQELKEWFRKKASASLRLKKTSLTSRIEESVWRNFSIAPEVEGQVLQSHIPLVRPIAFPSCSLRLRSPTVALQDPTPDSVYCCIARPDPRFCDPDSDPRFHARFHADPRFHACIGQSYPWFQHFRQMRSPFGNGKSTQSTRVSVCARFRRSVMMRGEVTLSMTSHPPGTRRGTTFS